MKIEKYTWNPDRLEKNEYIDKINAIICEETGLESPKDFDKYWTTYFYYVGEGEFEEYTIHLGLFLDNFRIYANAEKVLLYYEDSESDSFLKFLETEYCPGEENYGGDILTSGEYDYETINPYKNPGKYNIKLRNEHSVYCSIPGVETEKPISELFTEE